MSLDEINLHDALIKELSVDYGAKIVVINIAYYKTEQSPKRQEAIITFKKVQSISQITDFERLEMNAWAGNVNYWVPAEFGGITYIYFADGCLAIHAKKIAFKNIKSTD